MVQRPRQRSPIDLAGFLGNLWAFLHRRFRVERHGLGLRITPDRPRARHAPRPASAWQRDLLPPMPGHQVIAAQVDLRALLNRAPAARRVWPSLALLERVLGHGGFEGIHRVDACVLRHAAQSLDLMADHLFSPGLVMLRRRIELVLRRKHRDRPSHWARMSSPAGGGRGDSAEDTLTDFIDLDRYAFGAAARAAPRDKATAGGVLRSRRSLDRA
jgi:hypothetical protein